MKRYFLTLLAAVWLTGCGKQETAAPAVAAAAPQGIAVDDKTRKEVGVKVELVEAHPVAASISATGELQLDEDRTWRVGAVMDGRVVAVPVRLGQAVKAGTVVAQMHSHEVHDARATRRQAIAELERAKILLEQAGRVRARTQRLFDLKAASREQLEAAETQARSAQLSVTHAQAEVDRIETHIVEFLEVPLQPLAAEDPNDEADRVPIKSPSAGIVMAREANVGTVVKAGDAVVTISDLTSLWFIAAVNEADLSQVRPGQTVKLTFRAWPERTFQGKVLQLGEKLDSQSRTLQVRVLVSNAGGLLKPEMFGTADFAPQAPRTLIHVPESAVQEIEGKTVVFIQSAEGKFVTREVKAGARIDRQVEILAGLEPGMSVVTSGAMLLKSHLLKGEE